MALAVFTGSSVGERMSSELIELGITLRVTQSFQSVITRRVMHTS